MSTDTVSPLRQRMIEDMNARKLCAGTQRGHIRSCKRFAAFLKRSPGTATPDDIRRFQLHLAETGGTLCTPTGIRTGLKFLWRVTLRRLDLAAEIYHIREPQKIPLVMSQDETRRLLAVATSLKARVLVSLGYGCGLRAGEVGRLKVKHIDRAQTIIRVEQSKSRKDRNVMLSPEMLVLLRHWGKVPPSRYDAGIPLQERWLFPGIRAGKPMTTRQLNRLFHEAADAAGIRKGVTLHALRHSFATHLLESDTDIRIIQALLGHDKLDTTARYTRVATGMIANIESPLDRLSQPRKKKPKKSRTTNQTVQPPGERPPAVSRPVLEVADIFRDHGAAWRRANAGHVSLGQMKVMSAIEGCRTAERGGQGAARKKWLPEREADLLPVGYFHVVYTLPAQIAEIAYHNKAVVYDLLFKASAETTLKIAADPKHLGAHIGITAVLHTWGSALTHHPHVHMIVPGGGISADGSRWIASRPDFLVHVKVLARLFRGKFLAMLIDAHSGGQLKFFNTHAGLADKQTFKKVLAPLRRIKWVVYCKEPFAGPQQVLGYLSRYTHRVAISNRRLLAPHARARSVRWKDYRIEGPGRWKTMTLPPQQFLRRFLIHVLPKGFHRIRHYGLAASANRAANIARGRQLLAAPGTPKGPG